MMCMYISLNRMYIALNIQRPDTIGKYSYRSLEKFKTQSCYNKYNFYFIEETSISVDTFVGHSLKMIDFGIKFPVVVKVKKVL